MARDLWVFGYGSLMWRPDFTHVERHAAWIEGYHRALCVYSNIHRGTPERPGLVLGLDLGGECRGVAFRVEAALREETLAILREREMTNRVYHEVTAPVRLDDGRHVDALAFVVDRTHRQYACGLDRAQTLALLRQGVGRSGRNIDYVLATVDHLVELGVEDVELAALAAELRREGAEPARTD